MRSIILLKVSQGQENDINLNGVGEGTPSQITSTTRYTLLRICPYINEFNVVSHYFCYKDERCCKQGCCTTSTYKYFQSWYFWLIVIFLFLALYGASWYCKKLDAARKRRRRIIDLQMGTRRRCLLRTHRQNSEASRELHSNNPLGDSQCRNDQFQTVNAIIHSPNEVEPPPRYSAALKMPQRKRYSNTLGQTSQDPETTESPPTYISIVKDSDEKL